MEMSLAAAFWETHIQRLPRFSGKSSRKAGRRDIFQQESDISRDKLVMMLHRAEEERMELGTEREN